jgi:hypothetical protein
MFYKIAKAVTKKDSHGRTTTFGYGWVVRLWGSWTPWIDAAGGDLLEFSRSPGGSWLWDTFYRATRPRRDVAAGSPGARRRPTTRRAAMLSNSWLS